MLENDTIAVGGVRFVGATLWTDYRIFGEANQAAVMNACATGMNDYRLIGWQKQPWLQFRPQEAALLHHQSQTYLAESFNGPSVLVTHGRCHGIRCFLRFRSIRIRRSRGLSRRLNDADRNARAGAVGPRARP